MSKSNFQNLSDARTDAHRAVMRLRDEHDMSDTDVYAWISQVLHESQRVLISRMSIPQCCTIIDACKQKGTS